ncbi:MAG TPA: Clp protease N-terminal domain-containing protein [Solirubrobacteraceae bacterium]|nr:Clp protease N-terminal domain-containing protein [Solirubrobacteraceae bacterium]
MSFFPGHVIDLLRMAEDEARMLGRGTVDPEHLLLAFCRDGRGRDLIEQRSLTPRDLYSAVVRLYGEGDDLPPGRLPRSRLSEKVLDRVVAVAAERGETWPGEVEVLLALAADDRAKAILLEVGVGDFAQLIQHEHPSARAPVDDAVMRHHLLAAALNEHPRRSVLRVPAFERFSSQARRSIAAAAETAARLEHRHVEPFHLLLGCLQVPESLAARALAPMWAGSDLGTIDEAIEQARMRGPRPSHQATGIFTEAARRLVAENALALAYRHRHQRVGTGHLLLAVLDSDDPTTARLTWPHAQMVARTLTAAIPGGEQDAGSDEELEWIALDALMRTLVLGFRRVLPPGWIIRGSARSDIHFQIPRTASESDYQIRPGWITGQPGAGRDRLQQVIQWMLEQLQTIVSEASGAPWPPAGGGQPAAAHTHLIQDRDNPRLQIGYGDPAAPAMRVVEPDPLVNMLVRRV